MSDFPVAADQLKSIVQRVERLENEIADLNADKSEIYKEARANGFDVKAIKKVVSKRKIDEHEREEQDLVFETYWDAVHGSGLVHARTRENIEEFDAATGEVFDANPRLIKQVVDGMQTEAGRAALIAAVDIMIDREEAEEQDQPETANEMDRVTEGSFEAGSEAAEKGRKAIPAGPEGVDLNHAGAGESPATAIAPASHGEAEAPGDESEDSGCVGPGGNRPDANAGGDHVDAQQNAATHQAGPLVNQRPAAPAEDDDDAVEMESVPFQPMKRLHYVHCFPELTKAEHDRLTASIAQVGIEEPIVRMHDTILDGWARYNIARSLGLNYPVVSYHGKDVLLDVIAWQLAARDFTPAQQRKIAAALAKEIPHRAADIMAAFNLELEEA